MYEQIYKIVKQIPYGHVASYGQISTRINGCTPRLVGYALSSCPDEYDVPWHRVINSEGKIAVSLLIEGFLLGGGSIPSLTQRSKFIRSFK